MSLTPYCALIVAPINAENVKEICSCTIQFGRPFSLNQQSCSPFCKYTWLSAELLGGDLTDNIICDIGMPVIHRYVVMPIA